MNKPLDPDAFDADSCLIYVDLPDPEVPQVVDLIEQEFCWNSPDGIHGYLNKANYCCHCGPAHPSIRFNACGQP